MKKIIQIAVCNDDILCITEDGKVYCRRLKDKKEIKEEASEKYPHGRVYSTGVYYWQEMKEEEPF